MVLHSLPHPLLMKTNIQGNNGVFLMINICIADRCPLLRYIHYDFDVFVPERLDDVWWNEVTDVLVITLQGYIKFFKSKLLFGKCFILDMYWSISLFQTQVRNKIEIFCDYKTKNGQQRYARVTSFKSLKSLKFIPDSKNLSPHDLWWFSQ